VVPRGPLAGRGPRVARSPRPRRGPGRRRRARARRAAPASRVARPPRIFFDGRRAAQALADLVAALPLGIQHGADSLPLPFARTARDVGVALVWNTVADGRRDTYAAGRRRFGYVDAVAVTDGPVVCLNPFAVCGGRHGALCADGVVRADLVSEARVDGGVLVARGADVRRCLPADDGDLHVYDFEAWWLMLRTTVALRLDAFLQARHTRD